MPRLSRCGSGDTGCTGHCDSQYPMFDSMCHSVFAPVCAPEICNVPRIPHHQILVKGQGILLDTINEQTINFKILITRTMQVYNGQLVLENPSQNLNIVCNKLKFYEGDGHDHILALFYEESTKRTITVTLHQEHTSEFPKIFFDSATSVANPIRIHGIILSGNIELTADHNAHAH